MKIIWSKKALDSYLKWEKKDIKVYRRINILIKNIQITPFEGIGKSEPLKSNLTGLWSRRINKELRLLYYIKNDCLFIVSCSRHYLDL